MARSEAVTFARSVLELTEDKLYQSELEDLIKECAGERTSDKLRFANRLYKLISNLPLSLWPTEKGRDEYLMDYVKYLESATIRDLGKSQFDQLSNPAIRDEKSIFSKKTKV